MIEQNQKNYQIIGSDGFITLRLVGSLDNINEKKFLEEFSIYFIDPYPHIIVNCENTTFIAAPWYRALIQLKKMATNVNKKMFLIRANEKVKMDIKKQGLDEALISLPNLREALVECNLATKKQLDTNFVNPFLTATMHVLEVQANIEAIAQDIYIKKDKDKYFGDISGIIGIVSETFTGSVIISFPEATFLKIMSNMLGEDVSIINKETSDGAGELTNMIFGQAKITLNEKGYGIKTAIPSVVTGKDHSLSSLTTGPVVVIPFKSNAGEFYVEICLST